MREALITFNTARLAKEKGFKWNTKHYFLNDRPQVHKYYRNVNLIPNCLARPTQTLLQNWLREERDVFLTVSIDPDSRQYSYIVYHHASKTEKTGDEIGTWEGALEKGLRAALNLL